MSQDVRQGRPKSRKLRLIYPTFQLRMFAANLGTLLLVFGLTAWLVNDAFDRMLDTGFQAGMSASHPYFSFVREQSGRVIRAIGLSCLLGFVILAITTFRMSHQIAGPFVRLRGYFKGLSEGQPVRPVNFRRGDYFLEVPPLINAALERVASESGTSKAPSHSPSASVSDRPVS